MIKTFLSAIGSTQEVNFWLSQSGWSLVGAPVVTPGGALLWTLLGPAE